MQDQSPSSDIGQTRTAEIFDVLRDDIINGRLAPGQRLRFDALRGQYDIGISPLREALTQLVASGLAVTEQRKGFRVAPISDADLREIALLRGEFDALAIGQSILHGDELWEGRVLAAFHALSKRSKLGPDGEVDRAWEQQHMRFHAELVSECRLPKLLAFREILDLQALRYRRIAAQHYMRAGRDDIGEHRALCDAALARDAAAASALIHDHYYRTVEVILSATGKIPAR